MGNGHSHVVNYDQYPTSCGVDIQSQCIVVGNQIVTKP